MYRSSKREKQLKKLSLKTSQVVVLLILQRPTKADSLRITNNEDMLSLWSSNVFSLSKRCRSLLKRDKGFKQRESRLKQNDSR
jgi:hypothetical protein